MFSQDDILLYGAHGPCRYLGLEERRVNGKRQAFYVLEPLARAGDPVPDPNGKPRRCWKDTASALQAGGGADAGL